MFPQNIPDGTYTLTVKKAHHVPREETVTASGPFTKNLIITLWGDVNLDGVVDATDATLISNYFARTIAFDDYQVKVATVKGHGTPDTVDATLISQYLSWMIFKFPADLDLEFTM